MSTSIGNIGDKIINNRQLLINTAIIIGIIALGFWALNGFVLFNKYIEVLAQNPCAVCESFGNKCQKYTPFLFNITTP